MNTPFFMNVVLRSNPDRDLYKLLDTREYFKGTPKEMQLVFEKDFESDSLACEIILSETTKAACMNAETQFLGPYIIPLQPSCDQWIRMEGDYKVVSREWDVWKHAQWIIQFYKGEENIKSNMIRLHRLLPEDNVSKHIFFDVRIPDREFDKCTVTFWNASSQNTILIDNLKVSCFKE